jgi:hypothetical protein
MATQPNNSRGTILIAASGIAGITTFVAVVTVFDLNRFMLSDITRSAGPAIYVAMWGMVALAWVLLGSIIVDELRNGGTVRPIQAATVHQSKPPLKFSDRRFWYPAGVSLAVGPWLLHPLFEMYPALWDALPSMIVAAMFVTLAGFVLRSFYGRR